MGSGGVPFPVPEIGSQAEKTRAAAIAILATVETILASMPEGERPPPRLLIWWEDQKTPTQIALAFPVLAVLLFLVNLGPFSQPFLRSVLYGLFEGGLLTGLLIVATINERNKRRKP